MESIVDAAYHVPPVVKPTQIESVAPARRRASIGLTKNQVAVLALLNNRHPALCTLDDITNLSRNSAGKAVRSLIAAGYVHRPNGERDGATVTEKGKLAANRLAQIAH